MNTYNSDANENHVLCSRIHRESNALIYILNVTSNQVFRYICLERSAILVYCGIAVQRASYLCQLLLFHYLLTPGEA